MPSRRTQCRYASLALALCAGASLAAGVSTPASAQTGAAFQNFRLLNSYRQEKGAPAVRTDPALARAAQEYAQFLATNDKEGHTADGRSPEQRIRAAGFKGCAFAENVYSHWSSSPIQGKRQYIVDLRKAKMAHDWWRNSPGHDANMRNAKYILIGIGFASVTKGSRHIFKAVQNFGAPC